ncbi:hypothetical protein KsCSTR_42560 [Candidatus Kuenenia stuttgartiensis]|uniref:Uncharacterized protein n=1 Tax=Kuenenia stuttgartiensis TaxID=174633 RepID=Q1PXC4_KUEST|nr:hypothetical protein KsCSTR_42560 [Candidatus Kuenenia stuttgartiensis]CAJ71882.1 Hypothetical Protein kustc1137 [Candidatus Kuenenia stuttgartiensis]
MKNPLKIQPVHLLIQGLFCAVSFVLTPKSCKRFSQCENQYFPLPRLAKSDNRYPFFSNCGSAIVLL